MGTRAGVVRVSATRRAAGRGAERRTTLGQVRTVKAQVEPEVKERPLRPGQCRAHMRKVLAAEFRDIVKGFVEGAKSGSCQHVKLATELLESPKKAPARPSGRRTLNRLIHRLEQIDE